VADVGSSLLTAFDYVWDRFTTRLAGLTDDEYFWEPVPGCWSLRRAADGRWRPDGGGGGGPAPDPAPVTTITWRSGLASQSDAGMWSALGPGWGPYAASSQADLALHVPDELVHHAAENSLLRDLYQRRSELSGW
jgi:hypothetical protein